MLSQTDSSAVPVRSRPCTTIINVEDYNNSYYNNISNINHQSLLWTWSELHRLTSSTSTSSTHRRNQPQPTTQTQRRLRRSLTIHIILHRRRRRRRKTLPEKKEEKREKGNKWSEILAHSKEHREQKDPTYTEVWD